MDWVPTLILAPLAVVIIGLLVEYWIIQPMRQRRSSSIQESVPPPLDPKPRQIPTHSAPRFNISGVFGAVDTQLLVQTLEDTLTQMVPRGGRVNVQLAVAKSKVQIGINQAYSDGEGFSVSMKWLTKDDFQYKNADEKHLVDFVNVKVEFYVSGSFEPEKLSAKCKPLVVNTLHSLGVEGAVESIRFLPISR
jgi:hypothetical protein